MQQTHPESVGFCPERLARIQPVMQRYVDEGKFAGIQTLVARRGQVAHFASVGQMDIAAGRPMAEDAIFRIYSMTKPITSVAALMLVEEGRLRLFDPLSAYLPEFRSMKVVAGAQGDAFELVEALRPITIRDLFTHTAGFSYGFDENFPLDQHYRDKFWRPMQGRGANLKKMVGLLGDLPLAHQPGEAYRYSVAIDVLGYVVEVVSGLPFDAFLRQRIFEPLGMTDTGFWVPEEKQPRFALNYGPDEKKRGRLKDIDPLKRSEYTRPKTFFSGGGGLVSTTADYLRFCQMLLNGGSLDGARIIGRKTVDRMRTNHLPTGMYEDAARAFGFGLGGNVLLHPERYAALGTPGMWGWGGAANTKFWIDWKEDLIGILMTQFMPSDLHPVIVDYQNLVYQALDA
jgi:CubicO group peptidase (beta-lactamase class C family)